MVLLRKNDPKHKLQQLFHLNMTFLFMHTRSLHLHHHCLHQRHRLFTFHMLNLHHSLLILKKIQPLILLNTNLSISGMNFDPKGQIITRFINKKSN
jgi:hypothetical protein